MHSLLSFIYGHFDSIINGYDMAAQLRRSFQAINIDRLKICSGIHNDYIAGIGTVYGRLNTFILSNCYYGADRQFLNEKDN